jgi:hypothetical protein
MENIKKPETAAEKFAELEKFIDLFIQENKVPRPVIIEVDAFIKDVKEFIEKNCE